MSNIKFTNLIGASTTFKNIDTLTLPTDVAGVDVTFNYIQEVNKYNWEVTPPVASIAVTTPPTKITYTEGNTLDLTGIKVTATYTDATTADVTDQCTFNPANGTILATTDTKITITFGGKICEQAISVTAIAKLLIGGKIFYIHSDNGATYKFWDASDNELTTQTVEGLQNATKYAIVSGTPSADKFYVLNTSAGNNGLSSSLQWSNETSIERGTKNYNYTGGGKPATALVLPSLGDTSGTIWYWLKNIVNVAGNSTGCTDWYIGSPSSMDQLRSAIAAYPTIFANQSSWFSSLFIWSSIENLNYQPNFYAIMWIYSFGSWNMSNKDFTRVACAIRSF